MMLSSNETRARAEILSPECKLHWSEWFLIGFAFLAIGSMILHTIASGM